MKKLALILCILLLLSLVGCGAKEVSPESDPRLEPVCGDGPQETDSATIAKDEGPIPAYEIYTKYYKVPIPQEWADSCAYDIFEMDNGLDILSLYEVTAYDEFGGGKLCSIQLMPTNDETYKDFPDYEFLGVLNTPEGNFNLILLYPTDVQFTEETMDAYNEMAQKLPDVLCTISPKEGIEMAMPAPTP